MTTNQLVAVLARDQEVTQTRIEDLFEALFEIAVDTLSRGQTLRLGRILIARLRTRDGKPALNCYASDALRARLNLEAPKIEPEKCPHCQRRRLKSARQKRWAPKRKR